MPSGVRHSVRGVRRRIPEGPSGTSPSPSPSCSATTSPTKPKTPSPKKPIPAARNRTGGFHQHLRPPHPGCQGLNKRLWWKVEDSNPARTLDQLVTEPITVTSTVSVDLRRRGIARCEGSARCQSANSLTDQQLWPWSISYGSNLAGRIGVTEHITGPSASECCTRARGRQRGHVDLAWLLLGRSVGARP